MKELGIFKNNKFGEIRVTVFGGRICRIRNHKIINYADRI